MFLIKWSLDSELGTPLLKKNIRFMPAVVQLFWCVLLALHFCHWCCCETSQLAQSLNAIGAGAWSTILGRSNRRSVAYDLPPLLRFLELCCPGAKPRKWAPQPVPALGQLKPPTPRKLHVGSPLSASKMEGRGGFTRDTIFITTSVARVDV